MSQRKQMNRPKPGPRAPQGNKQPMGHRYWPYHHEYDCDWYDWYDYYHDWDYDYLSSAGPKSMPPSPHGPTRASEDWSAYAQGFKDGWITALEYMMNGKETVEPVITPTPPDENVE